MIRPAEQCVLCAELQGTRTAAPRGGLEGETVTYCNAYPKKIPDAIRTDRFDHRKPFPGDHGIRWTPAGPGVRHPKEAS